MKLKENEMIQTILLILTFIFLLPFIVIGFIGSMIVGGIIAGHEKHKDFINWISR